MAIDFSKNDLVVKAGLSAEQLTISQGIGSVAALFVSSSNKVGINTENPNEALTVVGNISAVGQLILDGYTTLGSVATLFTTNTAVGINNESPNEALTVVGNISATGIVYATNLNWEKRFDFVMGVPNVSYTGIAPMNSLESASVWDITKITYTETGLVSADDFALQVAWTDRYVAFYMFD